MKSIYIEISTENGVPTTVEYTNKELPKADGFNIVVEVKACALNTISTGVLKTIFEKNPLLNYAAGHDIAGVVVDVGEKVSLVSSGDRVVGILPLDSSSSGCANFCVLSEFDVVKIEDVGFEEASAVVGDGVKAYTALNYLGRVKPGETVLVTDPLSTFGLLLCQLCQLWGAKVLALSYSTEDKRKMIDMNIRSVVEAGVTGGVYVSAVMEETGGLGADVIVDNGVRLFSKEEDVRSTGEAGGRPLPHKHELLSCLAVGGRYVTCHPAFQLDPPDSQMLYARCATVGFLFPHSWMLSTAHRGNYLHILKDIMCKLASGELRSSISEFVTLDQVSQALERLQGGEGSRGKVVMKN